MTQHRDMEYHGVLPSATERITAPPPVDVDALPLHILRELRASHVGETVAVHLYAGVAAGSTDPGVVRFTAAHRAVERHHLELWDAMLPPRHRSRVMGFWRASGYLMGRIPTLLGPAAVYAVVAGVEHWVDGHYARQIALVRRDRPEPRLLDLMQACRNDEAHHSLDAARAMGRPPLPTLLAARALAWIAVQGSKLGVAVARWV